VFAVRKICFFPIHFRPELKVKLVALLLMTSWRSIVFLLFLFFFFPRREIGNISLYEYYM